uniref:DUF4804 domain-containing protein n=1 Tax=Hirondellea gigas TaxID=1518452 RepID=A0A6A7FR01_9CRUS
MAVKDSAVLALKDFKELAGTSTEDGEEISLNEVLERSRKHCVPFPVQTARLHHLLNMNSSYRQLRAANGQEFTESVAQSYINSAYPIIHEDLLPLLLAFLNYKKKSTQRIERTFYKDKTVFYLINRLIKNRPIAFLTMNDSYLLSNGRTGQGGFVSIGKDNDKSDWNSFHDLTLEELMSYDEMKLAALLGVSSHSPFINKGERQNAGTPGKGDHELDGVIIGQVGARFEMFGRMDWQDCVVYEKQNTEKNGYGKEGKGLQSDILKAWAKLWGLEYLPTFTEVNGTTSDDYKKHKYQTNTYFNNKIYKARIQIMAEVLLIEASSRSKQTQKKAYIHVVGLGLGVWQTDHSQPKLFIDAWANAIDNMPPTVTDNISHIDFSWIPQNKIKSVQSGGKYPNTDIVVVFSKRNLHDKVPKDCLLVCNYAWDSNSSPGNEYWLGSLTASGDPAAACSSSIAELHNHRINRRVDAAHLRIATRLHGVVTVPQYLQLQHQ